MFKKITAATAALLVAFMPLMSTQASAATTNLIANPDVQVGTTTTADGWAASNWGTNTFTTSIVAGHNSTRALQAKVTAYTDGAVNWYQNPSITVTAGQSYQYEVWYQSDVATQVGAEFAGIANPYMQIGTVAASPGVWTKYSATFTAPAGSTSVTVFNILASTGTLTTDDFSLVSYAPTPLARPLITVSFDDGWINQYTNATPILEANNIKATYNVLSGETLNADAIPNAADRTYMTSSEVKALYTSGHEIASHTIDHCSMTGNPITNGAGSTCPMPMTAASLKTAMETSKSTLETITGVPGSVKNFAYPYGDYNDASIAAGQAAGYTSQRTVEQGFNTKDGLDLTKLKGYEVNATTTNADVEGWVQTAIAQKSWLILFYHEVANTPAVPEDAAYTTSVADFATQMQYINNNRAAIAPVTVTQAISEITAPIVTPPVVVPNESKVAVYRMANWMTKERLFTTDLNEVNAIRDRNGWVYEGVAFNAVQ